MTTKKTVKKVSKISSKELTPKKVEDLKKKLTATKKTDKTSKITSKMVTGVKRDSSSTESKSLSDSIVKASKSSNKKQSKKPLNIKSLAFKVGDWVVYPSHGVGKITQIRTERILDQDVSYYLMYFEKERLSIKIPIRSASTTGLRKLVTKKKMDEVFLVIKSGVKKLKGMWSRRAQEYESKINSGDIILLAEVLRDLARDVEDSERSYSERIIYETVVYRLAMEYSVIYSMGCEQAKEKIISTAKDKVEFREINPEDDFDDYGSDEAADDNDNDSEDDDEYEDEDDFDTTTTKKRGRA